MHKPTQSLWLFYAKHWIPEDYIKSFNKWKKVSQLMSSTGKFECPTCKNRWVCSDYIDPIGKHCHYCDVIKCPHVAAPHNLPHIKSFMPSRVYDLVLSLHEDSEMDEQQASSKSASPTSPASPISEALTETSVSSSGSGSVVRFRRRVFEERSSSAMRRTTFVRVGPPLNRRPSSSQPRGASAPRHRRSC